ncbi:MAG: hypothetical protein DHS80DRAFT_26153 [Piptocephalis tieghemiana]|nr:MAG: hypothetical protein DHS80DRAFT_26153 [Piptocephalis tieghemiana]
MSSTEDNTSVEARFTTLEHNLQSVQKELDNLASILPHPCPRLVAVSKTKPASDIQALYDAGQRHFGENYLQELEGKVNTLPKDIRWHFIGGLQSNKCKSLASLPGLWAVETVDGAKKASLLSQYRSPDHPPLRVFLQVNTSEEEAKSGILPGSDGQEIIDLAKHVRDHCPRLLLAGIMTIGALDRSLKQGEENPDFSRLVTCRSQLAKALGGGGHELELSMGMSSDYLQAGGGGATNVRVGSRIFGPRYYPGGGGSSSSSS